MTAGVDVELVTAARRGDRSALTALLTAHLPLVHNVVGRALAGHADVDDVVQEAMLRVVERLPTLRDPERFRAWLVTIVIRQVRDHARRRAAARQVPLEVYAEVPDAAVDVAGEAVAGVDRAAARRDVLAAVAWLDSDDREVLALWWQELNGELTRADLAEALAVAPGHAAVRVQRMRARLAQAYTMLAAWQARPRCPELAVAARGWDGVLAPLWRKRLGRHVLACPRCLAAGGRRPDPARVLPTLAGLAVPAGLAAGLRAAVEAPAVVPSATAAASGATGGLRGVLSLKAAVAASTVAVVAVGGLVLAVRHAPDGRDGVVAAAPTIPGRGLPSARPAPSGSPSATPTPRPSRALTGVTDADIVVAPNGRDDGDGSLRRPFATLGRAVEVVRPGQIIALRGGTYRMTEPVTITTDGTANRRIVLSAYRAERPVLDAAALPADRWAVTQRTAWWTVQDLEVRGSRSHAWVCRSCAHTVFRRLSMHDNTRSGLTLRDPGTVDNQVLDSDFFRSYDPADPGGSGIGLAVKFGAGAGNVLRGNRAFHNADDGVDLGGFADPVTVERNWSYGNGQNRWGVADWDSNGGGFSLGGGEPIPAGHRVLQNATWGNRGHGFGVEANTGSIDLIGNTAFRNGGAGFDLTGGDVTARRNLAVENATPVRGVPDAATTGNSWDGGNAVRLRSTDPATAEGPRRPDGTLPSTRYLDTGTPVGADLTAS
ncbi:sigma-70 family RNA polymerase sigma factor [Micromonospora sp. WMMC241]|uniref:sigma-70 family RNA polymerase sigma factor n=1 Tax=Micromonospora sp. WMMC241 TaxID=3015159 RepID=UPI0022B6C5ED|nr:sigma-70 family RNA polymerase sigma factor [Micromonospora sp. WMMC241]MCZ7437046.1 sigma-70 family RNA polymerase sigma factor [Micromonospora sp. WMMC241]